VSCTMQIVREMLRFDYKGGREKEVVADYGTRGRVTRREGYSTRGRVTKVGWKKKRLQGVA